MMLLQKFIRHPQLTNGKAALWDQASGEYTTTKLDYARIAELVKQAHIFVIEDPAVTSLRHTHETQADAIALAPPFPVCWFEVAIKDGQIPICLIADKGTLAETDTVTGPVGALLHERRPGCYDLYMLELFANLVESGDGPGSQGHVQMTTLGVTVYRDVDTTLPINTKLHTVYLVNKWLQMINHGLLAVEHTNATVVIPRADRPHKRKPHQIRRIVRILPRNVERKAVAAVTQGGTLDWSHRWEVRGHWRRVRTLGKDREGHYVVPGFTWVSNFVKGPEDKPLVAKTRVAILPESK